MGKHRGLAEPERRPSWGIEEGFLEETETSRGLREGWEQAVQRAEGQRGPRVGRGAGGLWKLEVVLLERDGDFA